MNKKKIFGSIAVLTIAAMAAFNINVSSQEYGLSDISLDYVEALANENATETGFVCWQSISANVGSSLLHEKTYCITCSVTPATSWSNENVCIK